MEMTIHDHIRQMREPLEIDGGYECRECGEWLNIHSDEEATPRCHDCTHKALDRTLEALEIAVKRLRAHASTFVDDRQSLAAINERLNRKP